jgi:hypothetical protein
LAVGPVWLLMMWLLAKDIDLSWPNVLLILVIWAACGFLWSWMMWGYLQRSGRSTTMYCRSPKHLKC